MLHGLTLAWKNETTSTDCAQKNTLDGTSWKCWIL